MKTKYILKLKVSKTDKYNEISEKMCGKRYYIYFTSTNSIKLSGYIKLIQWLKLKIVLWLSFSCQKETSK